MVRGRPNTPKLSKTAIVSAALDLARRNEDPTLGKVARELGVHVTSLYNYFDDRADLINAVRDELSARRTRGPRPKEWAEAFRLLANGMHAMFTEYPGLIVPFAITPLRTTQIGTTLENLTARLEAAVGSRQIAEAGVRALNSIVIGAALDSLDPDTTPAHSKSALDLGVEGLIMRLEG